MHAPKRNDPSCRPSTSGSVGLGAGTTPTPSGTIGSTPRLSCNRRDSFRGRTPRRGTSSRKPRLILDDEVDDFDSFEDPVAKEVERLASETGDLLFYNKFLEKEVQRETILEELKLRARRPPPSRRPAHPPDDQRTISWTCGPSPLTMTARPIAEGTAGRANKMNQLSAAWYRTGRAALATSMEQMRLVLQKLLDMSITDDPNQAPETLVEAEKLWCELEMATDQARRAYSNLHSSLQTRRFKVTPMPSIEASYHPLEPCAPGRQLPSRIGDAYVPPLCPTPPPPKPSPPPSHVTDGTDISDANDLIQELWALEELAEELGRPNAQGTGVIAARERRRRATAKALETAASGLPSPFVVSTSSAAMPSQSPPPPPMSMMRAKNLNNISTLGGPGKKYNTPKESETLVSARRLAEVTRRKDAAAVAAAQAKIDAARLVSLPSKKGQPKPTELSRNVSKLRQSSLVEEPEPPPPKVITSRTRESAVPYEPRPGAAPKGFRTMGGGTVLPGPRSFEFGGTEGIFGDRTSGSSSESGGTRHRVSGPRSLRKVSTLAISGKVEDESAMVEAKARVQTSATMSLMEKNLAPRVQRSLVDPVQLQLLSRHVHGSTLSLAGGNWTIAKGRALAATLTPEITTLILANNCIDDQSAKALAEALSTPGARGISTLDLSNCRLNDRAAGILAPALMTADSSGRHMHIKSLSLEGNTAMGDNGIMALTLVGPNTVLTDVNISRCGITTIGAATVAELITDVVTLERLTLSWNNLAGGAGPLALRQALEEGTGLKFLDLGHCSLGQAGAAHIIRALASNHGSGVQELSFAANGLDVVAAVDIASMMVKQTGLLSLDMGGNPIGLDGAAALLAAAEAPSGALGSPIKLNINGCTLRQNPRRFPTPTPLGDPIMKDAEVIGKKGTKDDKGGKMAGKPTAPPQDLPEAIQPGLYLCDLADNRGRAMAVMLCKTREDQGSQSWRRATLDGIPVPDSKAATWPEALPLANQPKEEGAAPQGPWLEVEVALTAAIVSIGPQGRMASLAMTPDRFTSLWRDVMRDPATCPSGEWLCDYSRALANAGFFFTAAQVAEIVADMQFASARVDAAVTLWPRVVDPPGLTRVEDQLGLGACRATRGRLNASCALRLGNPTGRYQLHMSRAYDRSVAARLISLYVEEAALSKAGDLAVRSHLVGKDSRVGDPTATCLRDVWLDGKPATLGDVTCSGVDVTAFAAEAWEVPIEGVLTIDYVSHAKRVARDATVMPPVAFQELISRLTKATTVDAATVAAAATDMTPSPVAPAEHGAMGVEGFAARQHAAIASAVEDEMKMSKAASSGNVTNADCALHQVAEEAHAPLAGSWLAEEMAVADGTAFLKSAGKIRVLTPAEVTAWHVRLGFAASLAEAEAAAAAAKARGEEPPDMSGCVTEVDLSNLLRCHEIQPGAQFVRQFDPLTLVPLAVMDESPEGLLVYIAGDTLETGMSTSPPTFMLRPGDVVNAMEFLVPGGGFEEHSHPATLRAPRAGEIPPPPGGKKAPELPPSAPKKKGKSIEEPPPPPACVALASTADALRSLLAERPRAFESIHKAISGVKPSFPLGRGAPPPKLPKQAPAKKQGKKLNSAELEAERLSAIEAKVAALAAAAKASGPNATGTAAAQEFLCAVADTYAFTSAQVRRLLRDVPWTSAIAAENAAVTLFCRTVDPEAGFTRALCALPAASQMRVCQRLGWLNVLSLTDANMHFRLRLWRADERSALSTLLRMAHMCAVSARRYRVLKPGDAPYRSARIPPPGWRGVTIVPADGGAGDAAGALTIVPAEMSKPQELQKLLHPALDGDAAAQRVTIHFRFDITAEETQDCAVRWIQGAARRWFYRRMFLRQRSAVIRLQVMWRAKRLRRNVWIWGMAAQTPKLKALRAKARKAAEERAKIIQVRVFKSKTFSSYSHDML